MQFSIGRDFDGSAGYECSDDEANEANAANALGFKSEMTAEAVAAYVAAQRRDVQWHEDQRIAFNENIQRETTSPGKGVTDIDELTAALLDLSSNTPVVPTVTFDVVAAYRQEEDDNDTEGDPDRHTLIPNIRLYPQKTKVTTSATQDGPKCHAYVPLVFSSAESEAEFSNILALGSLCQLSGVTQQDLRVLLRSDRHTNMLHDAIRAACLYEHRRHANAKARETNDSFDDEDQEYQDVVNADMAHQERREWLAQHDMEDDDE